ncbi:cysteine synthase A [Anaerotruncus massiliensis (ex Liu et al. 2021)]|uniref:Cysteine synthase n=3 Tax=Anaerotruncus TaxID=244127 RepID=A0A498CM22_9FIRM|nr:MULTISPECIES: cysteine synthase A [Anaerotruncus]MBC3939542.1 cysteine synthase A [Anaerotruncus massiliensis (ex Togo et al. 2019)]RLL08928.1 cysteine synthase A [Anaerotruncus massiliensis (ex Liu et al. 2021)]
MNIKNDLTQLIGNTPLMYLANYSASRGLAAKLAVKLEYFNPLGSIKDRAAYAMVVDAEKRGLVKEGTVIIEPTSGNTGIGLAFVCAARGYRLILTMPETMSRERRALLAALGAELVLTEGAKGMTGAIEKAAELASQLPSAFIPQQFENPANPAIHEATTAKEILRDTDGRIDILVATFGTGGTVSGVGRALKRHNPDIRVVGVEPAESPLVSEGRAGPHGIQGIGANLVPANLDRSVLDEIATVTTGEAFEACRAVARQDGLLVGVSSGAAIAAAAKIAAREENAGRLIVAVCPDTGERYLSSGLYEA